VRTTYRAMQVSKPSVLVLVERPTPMTGPSEVLIEVHACGICGADINDIENAGTLQRIVSVANQANVLTDGNIKRRSGL